jgi:hypothetical protein
MAGHVQRQKRKEMVNINCSVVGTKSTVELKSGTVNW